MKIGEAKTIVGSDLGKPSKMPGHAFGLSAELCKVGGKLRDVPGSVCHGCYALKANYMYPSVKVSHSRRHAGLEHPAWVPAMVALIQKRVEVLPVGERFFRWHDSGDLQSVDHLHRIVEVCRETPTVRHWLPTRERGMVAAFGRMFGAFPANLAVRLSDNMVNETDTGHGAHAGLTSGVTTAADSANCRAFENGGRCGPCRLCWDTKTARVKYLLH